MCLCSVLLEVEAHRAGDGLAYVLPDKAGLLPCSRSGSLSGAPSAPLSVLDPGTVKLLDAREEEEVEGFVLSVGRFLI